MSAPSGAALSPRATFLSTLREGGVLLLAIIAVALVARVINLGSDYWIDEIYSLKNSFRLPLAGVVTTFLGDNHHPLYSVLARVSLVLFGESPSSVRLPAMAFGVASVAATYVVARLVAPRRDALIASLLLAVSYHHVWFSQNARGYTMLGFFAMVSTWLLVRMLEQGSWRLALAYALCAAVGAYTHLMMVFVACGHALVALIEVVRPQGGRHRIDWRVPALAFLLAAPLTVLFYAPMLGQVVDYFTTPTGLRGTSTPLWAVREGIRVLLVGFGAAGVVVGGLVLLGGAVVGIAGFVAILRANRNAALAFALPPFTVIAGALAGRGTMYPRFFFFAAGFAVIMAVRGLFVVGEFARRRWPRIPGDALASALAALVIVASAASLRLNYRYPKQNYVGAMQYVLASKAPDDGVAFAGVPGDPYRTIYGQDWPTITSLAELQALRDKGRTWLVYTFPRYLARESADLARVVEQECRQRAVMKGTVGGGDMIICTFEPA